MISMAAGGRWRSRPEPLLVYVGAKKDLADRPGTLLCRSDEAEALKAKEEARREC